MVYQWSWSLGTVSMGLVLLGGACGTSPATSTPKGLGEGAPPYRMVLARPYTPAPNPTDPLTTTWRGILEKSKPLCFYVGYGTQFPGPTHSAPPQGPGGQAPCTSCSPPPTPLLWHRHTTWPVPAPIVERIYNEKPENGPLGPLWQWVKKHPWGMAIGGVGIAVGAVLCPLHCTLAAAPYLVWGGGGVGLWLLSNGKKPSPNPIEGGAQALEAAQGATTVVSPSTALEKLLEAAAQGANEGWLQHLPPCPPSPSLEESHPQDPV